MSLSRFTWMWSDSFFPPCQLLFSKRLNESVCVSLLSLSTPTQLVQSTNVIMSRLDVSQTASDSCLRRTSARGVSDISVNLHVSVFPCNAEPKKEVWMGELVPGSELPRCLAYIQSSKGWWRGFYPKATYNRRVQPQISLLNQYGYQYNHRGVVINASTSSHQVLNDWCCSFSIGETTHTCCQYLGCCFKAGGVKHTTVSTETRVWSVW